MELLDTISPIRKCMNYKQLSQPYSVSPLSTFLFGAHSALASCRILLNVPNNLLFNVLFTYSI